MSAPSKDIPSRATTNASLLSEEAVPEVDPTSTAGLLAERLQAWKHAVSYLEDYMASVEKIHKAQAKEYEKALKAISHPLKEGHHFDQSLGGVAGFFENMRTNTQALINTNIETEKAIKGSVLPVLERLYKEIKHKSKELAHGAHKDEKEVNKARNTTQKHIELLGQQTASFESTGGRIPGHEDPYVVRRGVLHRLGNQVIEENNHRNNLIAIQNNFQSFEAHVIGMLQQAMEAFTQLAGGQGDKARALHSDMLGAIQRIPPDFEWKRFVTRSGDRLVDPHVVPRTVEAITFPNMDHPATRPLIEGSLERKSRNKLSWGYSTGYYVVTPSKFLHEFKDSDDARHDPKPELSIYLPDAVIGSPNGDKFNVKGKDRSKTLSSKLSGTSELAFKAHTATDALRWFEVIKTVAGATGPKETSPPVSPDITVASGSDDKLPEPETEKKPEHEAVPSTEAEHKEQESGITSDDKDVVPEQPPIPVANGREATTAPDQADPKPAATVVVPPPTDKKEPAPA